MQAAHEEEPGQNVRIPVDADARQLGRDGLFKVTGPATAVREWGWFFFSW